MHCVIIIMANIDTKWVKFGEIKAIAFLGKEVIAIASGIHIIFINLNTKDERVEKFDNRERGDGASCLAGHPVVPMFAIAERCLNPKISIFTYPEIHKVSSCIYNRASRLNGFISSTFAGTEYLITLTSFPDFQLIVWLWRTGENLKIIDTKIMDNLQRITCSSSSPFWLTQLGENTGQLKLYEMTVCSKIISLNPASNFISIVSSSWSYDGNLLLCDDLGNVSLYYCDGKRRHVIVNSNIQLSPNSRCLVVEFRGGVVIANAYSQILFYRKSTTERVKSGSLWKFIWQIETCSSPVFIIRHPYRDSLLIHTNTGELVEVSVGDDDVPRMQMICYQGSGFTFIVPINPDGHCIGVIDTSNRLIIMNSLTGNLLSTTPLDNYGKILQAVAHTNLPFIVTSTNMGKCDFISAVNVGKPVIIRSIFLTLKSLDKLKFSMDGNVLGVANVADGELFIINDVINMKFQILTVLNIPASIVDFLIYKNTNGCLVILILIKSHSTIYIGNNIIIYNVNELTLVTEIENIIELPNIFKFLHYGETEYDIIASPYLTKQLYMIKINKDYKITALTDALSLSHQLRDININSQSRLILTFGYDGIVIVRSKTNIHSTISIFLSHHRRECGIKFAIASLHHNIILCLGQNGNLVATKLSQLSTILNSSLDSSNTEDETADAPQVLSTFALSKLNEETTWIELKYKEQLENERKEMATKRELILESFQNLKKRLKKLLDTNEKESDDAKLNIATFNLDADARDEQIKLNTIKKEALMRDLEEQIYCHDKLTGYLRETYWDSMLVPACTIISLDGEICVNNYPIPVEDFQKEEIHQEWMKLSNDISQQDPIIEKLLAISNTSIGECPKTKNINYIKGNEDDEDEQLAMSGTTTHQWIHDDSLETYDQINRDNSSIQGMALHIIVERRKKQLKEYFNNLFENMQMKKEEEIKSVNEQISRINHCLSELKEMFGIHMSVDYDNIYLNWHDTERPQTIVTVEDSEVYKLMNDSMDVSNETCINKSTVEYEKNSSDNYFWDETLDKIMDGVLEVRWEDEIKKDIVKPDCLSKKMENCTVEELEMIRVYESSVENLKLERLKYKLHLEKGVSEIQTKLRKSVENFNAQLKTFFLQRIKIESAILQEDLLSLRELQRHQWHQQSMAEIQQIEYDELNSTILELKKFSEESTILELTVNEIKTRYDNLIKREKLLEGKFRGEFPDLKQPMVEHLLRHYKKRPRIGQLTCTSVSYLTEMSKCIVSGEKSEILPRECIDFLKGMQSLDVMPSSLPSQIDSNHWFILCRIRRAKVEIETRLKGCAVELAEAEQTFSSHQKTILNAQNRIYQLRETIDDIKRRNCETLGNVAVQLVLKMGQIEIQLCGHSSELGNAVLVPFDEVLRVNDAIVKAGRNKVVAMNKTIMFRRTIEWREWRHRCLKLTLEDMKEDLRVLQSVKVTKEIQEYLRRHLHTNGLSKDTEIWERSLMSTEKLHMHMIANEKQQLVEVTKAINEWQQNNNRLIDATDKLKLANLKLSLVVNDETRVRDEKFRQAKSKAIMKRNRLITKVQDNYEELLALRSQLELLRLKTYPTLRRKTLMRDKKRI